MSHRLRVTPTLLLAQHFTCCGLLPALA